MDFVALMRNVYGFVCEQVYERSYYLSTQGSNLYSLESKASALPIKLVLSYLKVLY